MYKLNKISKVFYKDSIKAFLGLKKPESVQALNNLSFEFQKGEIIGVEGKNGSGKSTLLRILGNILLPDSGSIDYFGDKPITSYVSSSERSFFWRLTVFENLEFFGAQYGISKAERRKKIFELSKSLFITNLLDRQFMELSTGNKKKISFARCLLRNPDIFLFDEITSSLDTNTQILFIEKLKDLLLEHPNKIIFWVSHDSNEIKSIASRVIKINAGEIFN